MPPAPDKPKPSKPKYLSSTDLQVGWTEKHGPGEFACAISYLIDMQTIIILDVEASPARFAAEVAATKVCWSANGSRPTRHVAARRCWPGCWRRALSRISLCRSASTRPVAS